FLLAGIIFLLVAVLGRIEGKIEPGNAGRVGAAIVGVLLVAMGLAMYFLDGDAVRTALRDGAARSLAPHASASAVRVDPPGLPITVVAGTYGHNCGAPLGNVTTTLARTCNGRSTCNVAIDAAPAEGATSGCGRDYAAEWKCGSGTAVYTATVPAGAGRGARVTLACAG
ncbi:MAG TPA: hypothetical protein VKD22_01445, partial [Ramlibacter sp.]|nr:hypothetical protein [Ramlibacter sp.]